MAMKAIFLKRNQILIALFSLILSFSILFTGIETKAAAARWHPGTPKAIRGNWGGRWQYIPEYKETMRVTTKVTKKRANFEMSQSAGYQLSHTHWRSTGHGVYLVKGIDEFKKHSQFLYKKLGRNKLGLYINGKCPTNHTPFHDLFYKQSAHRRLSTVRGD